MQVGPSEIGCTETALLSLQKKLKALWHCKVCTDTLLK